MKILYDYQAFDMQDFGGVSNSFVQLISNLPKEVEYEIALEESNNVHLKESELWHFKTKTHSSDNFLTNKHFAGKTSLYKIYSRLFPHKTSYGKNRSRSIDALVKGGFDVFHPTFFDDYFLEYLNNKPYILTVHDMIPELFSVKRDIQIANKRKFVKSASHIVAVSEKTKCDLMEMLKVPESKVTVIYHGRPNKIAFDKTPIVNGRYILYVGQRRLYKNFVPMVNELIPFLTKNKDVNLVCTGEDFTKDELALFEVNNIQNRVISIRPNEKEMTNLYANALCFIYPSAYEGFGIPILEAFSADCPVLLNNASCFPEIAGNAAIYFNLGNGKSDLNEVMEAFLAMSSQDIELLKRKQQERLQYFSWKKSALSLCKIYESVI